MALRIGQFVTTCHVPRRYRNDADLVDQLARGRFAKDLGNYLGPSLARQPAIVRVRHLPIRVIVPTAQLNEDSLARAWTEAFGKALFTALAYPTGAGPFEVYRADSVADFVASAIRDLLEGTAATQWQYAEFKETFRLGSTAAALTLLCQWPEQTAEILLELARAGALDRLLGRFDEVALERLFAVLASPTDADSPALSIVDLIAVAKLALQHPPERFATLRSRGYALRLYVETRRLGETGRSPRALFHCGLTLAILLSEDLSFLLQDAVSFQSPDEREEAGSQRLPPAVATVLRSVAQEARGWPESPRLAELTEQLTALRSELKLKPPSTAAAQARWISSDWCGLFFLASTLDRLGWVDEWSKLSQFQSGGISCMLAALALAIAGKSDPDMRALDEGIALFAGWFEQPDLAQLRRFLQDPRAELPRLQETLLHSFASRIRGFREATTQTIVRTFIQRSGRIRIQPDRIVVIPEPSPFHVALHIAGLDAPMDGLPWLSGRRLEFELGNL